MLQDDGFTEISLNNLDAGEGMILFDTIKGIQSHFTEIEKLVYHLQSELYKYA